MVGNDVVDLRQAAKESNWRRKGYLEKIFTPTERFLINTANEPEIMVWLFWSMKESAYKIASSESKIRTFAPTLICCNNLIVHADTATGHVSYQDKLYFTQTKIATEYLHTIAAEELALLDRVKIILNDYDDTNRNYHETKPDCVSHHGRYLALIYL